MFLTKTRTKGRVKRPAFGSNNAAPGNLPTLAGRKSLPTPKTPAHLLYRTRFQFENREKTTKYTCPHTLPAELTHVAARSST